MIAPAVVVWQALSPLVQRPMAIPRWQQAWAQANPQHRAALAAQHTPLWPRRPRLARQSPRLLAAYQAAILSLSA